MYKLSVLILPLLLVCAHTSFAQTAPAPTDRTKASVYSAADLAAAIAKLSDERPSSAVRVFTLAPYNVSVERRLPRPQGASLHETQAELFYVIEGSATLLTGGSLVSPTRNGTNMSATAIEGGVRQTFGKGDFLLVPSGIPHQFVDIKAPVQLMSIYLPNPTQGNQVRSVRGAVLGAEVPHPPSRPALRWAGLAHSSHLPHPPSRSALRRAGPSHPPHLPHPTHPTHLTHLTHLSDPLHHHPCRRACGGGVALAVEIRGCAKTSAP